MLRHHCLFLLICINIFNGYWYVQGSSHIWIILNSSILRYLFYLFLNVISLCIIFSYDIYNYSSTEISLKTFLILIICIHHFSSWSLRHKVVYLLVFPLVFFNIIFTICVFLLAWVFHKILFLLKFQISTEFEHCFALFQNSWVKWFSHLF